jgi:hypothetical protein
VTFDGVETIVPAGSVGMSPGVSITGTRDLKNGFEEVNNEAANACAADRRTIYDELKGKDCIPANKGNELGKRELSPGVYCDADAALTIDTGDLTLVGTGEGSVLIPNKDVWIFQASSSLLTSLKRDIILTNGAKAENVFWAVGSSATIGTYIYICIYTHIHTYICTYTFLYV